MLAIVCGLYFVKLQGNKFNRSKKFSFSRQDFNADLILNICYGNAFYLFFQQALPANILTMPAATKLNFFFSF